MHKYLVWINFYWTCKINIFTARSMCISHTKIVNSFLVNIPLWIDFCHLLHKHQLICHVTCSAIIYGQILTDQLTYFIKLLTKLESPILFFTKNNDCQVVIRYYCGQLAAYKFKLRSQTRHQRDLTIKAWKKSPLLK